MKNSINFRRYAFSTILGLAFGSAGAFFINSEKRESSPHMAENNSQESSRKQNPRRSQASAVLNFAEKGDPEDVKAFLENWLGLHPKDRDYIVAQLQVSFSKDPDKYYAFVRDFTLELYQADRSLALSTIAYFPREERIRTLERHILNDWVTTDPEALFGELFKAADENLAVNSSQLYQLASIFSDERVEQFDDYIEWISELDQKAAGTGDLQRAGYEALSFHAPAEFREELFNDLMNRSLTDHRFRSFPAILIGEHAADAPEEAMAWLDEMAPGPWKDESLYRFLNTTGQTHPQVGADLMNRESFLAEFSVAWERSEDGVISVSSDNFPEGEREKLYDSSLEHFLSNALKNDPTLVYESAEAFFDPELKENFQFAATLALAQEESNSIPTD